MNIKAHTLSSLIMILLLVLLFEAINFDFNAAALNKT
jgi:hypothetical protein